MTFCTEVDLAGEQQRLMIRGVRIVAVQAVAIQGRRMNRPIRRRSREVVALQAGPFVWQSDLEVLLMAERALELGVYRGSHQTRVGSRVGWVTGGAIAGRQIQATMRGVEGIIRVVALGTEGAPRGLQQIGVGRTVWLMTVRAAIQNRLVSVRVRKLSPSMAARAELHFGLNQQSRMIGSVRIVTGRTVVELGMPMLGLEL